MKTEELEQREQSAEIAETEFGSIRLEREFCLDVRMLAKLREEKVSHFIRRLLEERYGEDLERVRKLRRSLQRD